MNAIDGSAKARCWSGYHQHEAREGSGCRYYYIWFLGAEMGGIRGSTVARGLFLQGPRTRAVGRIPRGWELAMTPGQFRRLDRGTSSRVDLGSVVDREGSDGDDGCWGTAPCWSLGRQGSQGPWTESGMLHPSDDWDG